MPTDSVQAAQAWRDAHVGPYMRPGGRASAPPFDWDEWLTAHDLLVKLARHDAAGFETFGPALRALMQLALDQPMERDAAGYFIDEFQLADALEWPAGWWVRLGFEE
jgi:hypothetical protein